MKKLALIFALLCLPLVASAQAAPAQVSYAAQNLPNFFVDANNFAVGIYSGPVLFSQLSSLTATNLIYVQDGLLGSNPCTGGGTGSFAFYINGGWNCAIASTGTTLPITVVPAGNVSALTTAISSCPQPSGAAGCDIWLSPGTPYALTATLPVNGQLGVHLHGIGAVGTGGCSTVISTSGPIYAITVGNGSPDSSGFQLDNICFKDSTGNGLGGIDLLAIRDIAISNVVCFQYYVGACLELNGDGNFTQFSPLINISTWQTKYRIQTTGKTASFHVIGGEGNCQNSGLTDVISGSVDIDLGYTNHTASTGTASEWFVSTQSQNCQIGRGLWNAGGNKFIGDKAVEETLIARPNGSFGVVVDGDTASLANDNEFVSEQITKAGTGFWIKPSATNTAIASPLFNGTNGADLVVDSGALTTTRLESIKRWTGWQTNLADISRSGNVVTAHTVCLSVCSSPDNASLSIVAGAKVKVFQVTGSTTDFNGAFPTTSVSTNDSTGVTTLTWAQTGANESGSVTALGCNGNGSCIAGLSTVTTSGAGVIEITGDNITQNIVLQTPSLPNQENFVQLGLAGTANLLFNGSRTVINENNSGLVHLVDGGTVIYNGTGVYTPQPTVDAGGFGTVNTSGTTVTWSSGNFFGLNWAGQITINNVVYTISSVTNQTTIALTGSAGTQTGVNYNASGLVGVPPCSSPSGGVCQSSDDKHRIVFTNTNGATLCLPPIVTGYPLGYGFSVEYEPGSTVAQYASVTPPGSSSYYSQSCLGTAALFRGSSSAKNLSGNQGVFVYNNGANWEAVSGSPDVTLDEIGNALFNTAINLSAGNYNGGGSGANNGGDYLDTAGSSNSTGGRGGDRKISSGPDSASGTNGSVGTIQEFNSGVGLATKTGFIVRVCADVTGTDCSSSVPSGNSGAVRLTVSGTDVAKGVGIVVSGSGAGNPSQVQLSGVYGHSTTDGAVTESNCVAGNYYEIGGSGLDNGAGDCTTIDSPRRVGIALLAATGSTGTPGHVPILILPNGGSQIYSTQQSVTGAIGLQTAATNSTGSLQRYHVSGIVSCRATASGDTVNLNIQWTDNSSTVQNLNGAALCTTLGSASYAQLGSDVFVSNGSTIQWQVNTVTNTHTSTWDLGVSVSTVR